MHAAVGDGDRGAGRADGAGAAELSAGGDVERSAKRAGNDERASLGRRQAGEA